MASNNQQRGKAANRLLHRRPAVISVSLLLLTLLWCSSSLAAGPSLVLYPVEVDAAESDMANAYGGALQEALQSRYKVYYGPAVEQFLKKEYEKVDCTTEKCSQNVAVNFNTSLVANTTVQKKPNGYVITFAITDVLTNEIKESKTVTCRGCDSFDVIERLGGLGNVGQPSRENAVVPPPATLPRASVSPSDPAVATVGTLPGQQEYLQAVALMWNANQTSQSFDLAASAMAKGHPYAIVLLANYHAGGRMAPKDEPRAREYFRKGILSLRKQVDKGDLEAICLLGSIDILDENGQPLISDWEKVRMLNRAVSAGHAGAMVQLGLRYGKGKGVELNKGREQSLYKDAAEHGNTMGMVLHGMEQMSGKTQAGIYDGLAWIRKSAEGGNAMGQLMLGEFYRDGIGVDKNREKAIHYYTLASRQGVKEAEAALKNLGVPGGGQSSVDAGHSLVKLDDWRAVCQR